MRREECFSEVGFYLIDDANVLEISHAYLCVSHKFRIWVFSTKSPP